MSENSRTDGARTLGTRARDWFNGGDPDGPAKIRTWATGDDDRWHGYTHSMGKYVTWLMVIACILYPFTRGIGSILALVVVIFPRGPASARSVRTRSRPRRPARRRRRPAARPTPAGARYRWMTSPRTRPQRSGRIRLLTAPEQLLGGSQAALRRLRTGGT